MGRSGLAGRNMAGLIGCDTRTGKHAIQEHTVNSQGYAVGMGEMRMPRGWPRTTCRIFGTCTKHSARNS